MDSFARFEVGKKYYWVDSGYDPIEVVRRTEKTVWVNNGNHTWATRIKRNVYGHEYIIDTGVSAKHRELMRCVACWEVKG